MKHIRTIVGLALAISVAAGLMSGAAGSVSAAGSVKINKTNFPDDVFRKYVSSNFDKNKDGTLSTAELLEVLEINVERRIDSYDDQGNPHFVGTAVKTVKGIEFFPNLLHLTCNGNEITTIDVSKNTNLDILHCALNKIEKLDVSKNIYLTVLECMNNKLTKLDVSKNTRLEFLSCGYNALQKLDVTKNTKLTSLYCSAAMLDKLDVTHNPKLNYLTFNDNKLTSIDLSACKELKDLNCVGNALKSLDISGNKKLVNLTAFRNKFKTLNIKGYGNLETVSASENELTSVNISDCKKLVDLDLKTNKTLTKASVKNCPKLEELDLSGCKVQDLDVTGSTGLKMITASSTYLKNVKASVLPGKLLKTAFEVYTDEDDDLAYKTAFGAYCYKIDYSSVASFGFEQDYHAIKAKQPGNTSILLTYCDRNKLDILSSDIVKALENNDPGPFEKAYPQYTHKVKVNLTVLYKDVTNESDFWYTPTYALSAKGVVKGYDNQTKFKPANECTRAQMVTFLWRLAGSPEPKSADCKFGDVKNGEYYYKAVIWAVERGITTGYSDGNFKPQNVCTRAQTVTFLWRMAGKPSVGSAKNPFSDVKAKDYFYDAVIWASSKKIVAGYTDGSFKPSEKCLRRQMVTFLYKYDKNVKK